MTLHAGTKGCDLSKWNGPTIPPGYDFYIIQASHGQAEEPGWRDQFNQVVHAGKPLGLYHFAESTDPAGAQAEARFFHGLVGFLQPEQVHMGFWLDAETGQNAAWLDNFRSVVALPWCGVYGSLNDFNSHYPQYMHFGLNWLAEPDGVVVPGGWSTPDHILRQSGIAGGVDVDLFDPAQPYPPAWN